MPIDDYNLFTTADLVNELRKYSSAYTLIYIKHDEDIGPNAIKTNINCYETAKMQVFGLTSKLNQWMKEGFKTQAKQGQESIDSLIINNDGKDILEVLRKRCNAGVAAIIFNDNHEVYFKNWETARGQSMGLATELYEKIMNQ